MHQDVFYIERMFDAGIKVSFSKRSLHHKMLLNKVQNFSDQVN